MPAQAIRMGLKDILSKNLDSREDIVYDSMYVNFCIIIECNPD